MSVLKIRTINGHECFIEEEDLKHYKDAEVLSGDDEQEIEEPEDE